MQIACGGENWLTNYKLTLFLVNTFTFTHLHFIIQVDILMKFKTFLLGELLSPLIEVSFQFSSSGKPPTVYNDRQASTAVYGSVTSTLIRGLWKDSAVVCRQL